MVVISSRSGSSLFRTVFVWLGVGAFAMGCATLPPAKAVTNVNQIAGKWQGSVSSGQGTQPAAMTINPDGTYSTVMGSRTFTGKIAVAEGKLHGRGDQTGNTGTWSVHEGDGKRVLVYKADDGRVTGEWTPAK
jgi:hypothetical protein